MNITLYNFSKRKNSTKQPTGGTVVTAVLKENTTIDSPTFILSSNDFTTNYVKAFGQYYWVTSITSTANNLIEIACTIDVLATYKSSIVGSSQFVERSSSNYDTELVDTYVSIKNEEVINTATVGNDFFTKEGVYIISVLNDVGSGAGFTTYYAMNTQMIKNLSAYCNANLADSAGIADVLAWLQATFLKTADAIINCTWLPISVGYGLVGDGLSVGQTLKVGKDDVSGVTGSLFTGTAIRYTGDTITIPYEYTDFRKGLPYTKAFIYLPCYGVYQFNPLDFPSTISYVYDIDLATGDTSIYLRSGGNLVTTLNINIGVTCPVGKVGNNAGGVIGSVAGTAAGIVGAVATGGATAVASGIGAAASAINGVTSAASISPSVHGSQAGRSFIRNGLNTYVIVIAHRTTDPANLNTIVGRPLMQYRSLSGLAGYVKCADASIDVACNDAERAEINALLDSGIYLE